MLSSLCIIFVDEPLRKAFEGINATVAKEGPPTADLLGTLHIDFDDDILLLVL